MCVCVCVCIYIYISSHKNNYLPEFGLVGRVFPNSPGDLVQSQVASYRRL